MRALLPALLAALLPPGFATAHAQELEGPPPPPERDTQSPTGVSLTSGSYSTSSTDLKIGQGDFPQALVYERQYSSGLDIYVGNYDGLRGWGWTTNLSAYLGLRQETIDFGEIEVPPGSQHIGHVSVIQGAATIGSFTDAGMDFIGPFEKYELRQGTSLVQSGNEILFTDRDGTQHYFLSSGFRTRTKLVAKDGTELTFVGNGGLGMVTSNRGYAILFDGSPWTRACAVNLTEYVVDPTTPCPAGAQYVDYTHESSGGLPNLLTATNAKGETTTYGYTAEDQINCITLPGQSSCKVSNVYSNCVRHPSETTDPPGMNAGQQVLSQTLITGETITYNGFAAERRCPPDTSGSGVSMILADGSSRYVQVSGLWGGLPSLIRDALNRETTFVNGYEDRSGSHTKLISATLPEGDEMHFGYDLNGNITTTTRKAKPGSGLPDQVWGATYGPCNQPITQTDPLNNVTNMTYSTVHCGILKRTLPADVNGVRPETRYSYVQKYAWILKAGGGFEQAGSPVWVLASEEYCRTSAADANGDCAAGAADEVVTTYEYQEGSATKGSNIWLVGTAVTADGQTLRSCISYDSYGRKVSETSPRAGLASCQ